MSKVASIHKELTAAGYPVIRVTELNGGEVRVTLADNATPRQKAEVIAYVDEWVEPAEDKRRVAYKAAWTPDQFEEAVLEYLDTLIDANSPASKLKALILKRRAIRQQITG